LVCFRYTGGAEDGDDDELNDFNEKLLNEMTKDTMRGFIVSGKTHNIIYLRFVICNHSTTKAHVEDFFAYMSEVSE
jgi:hypothetical protein